METGVISFYKKVKWNHTNSSNLHNVSDKKKKQKQALSPTPPLHWTHFTDPTQVTPVENKQSRWRERGVDLHSGHSVLTRSTLKGQKYLCGTRVREGLMGLNKGLKCPLTVKYISVMLSGMSKSAENKKHNSKNKKKTKQMKQESIQKS